MLVRNIMQVAPVTANLDTPLSELARLLARRGFRHVPIMDDARLIGIVSDRDLKQAISSAALATNRRERGQAEVEPTAGEIMTRRPTTIGPTASVEEAARLMVAQRISALPVTEGDLLLGIVTDTDVLQLFVRALGVLEPSSQLDVTVHDASTSLGEVVHIVEGSGCRIASAMTVGAPTGERELVLRLATIDPRPAMRALLAKGYRVRNSDRLDSYAPAAV